MIMKYINKLKLKEIIRLFNRCKQNNLESVFSFLSFRERLSYHFGGQAGGELIFFVAMKIKNWGVIGWS